MGLDMKFGIGKILVLVGAVLIFVCTFFPWMTTTIEMDLSSIGGGKMSESESGNGWDMSKIIHREEFLDLSGEESSAFFFGPLLFLVLAILGILFAFLGPQKIILIIVGGLATVFYAVNAFIGAPSETLDMGPLGKFEYGAGWGLYMGLISGIILLVGAILIKKADGAPAAAAPAGAPAPEQPQQPAPGSYEDMYGAPPPQQPPQTPPPY